MSNKWELCDTDELLRDILERPERIEAEMRGASDRFGAPLKGYLGALAHQHGATLPAIVERSQLSKAFVYQIFAGDRAPGREALIRIALAMGASLDETQRALSMAAKPALYPRVRRDAALILCISRGLSVADASEFLESIGERALL